MKTAFLKSTAAAALVLLSLGAQANAVTLNFDSLLASDAIAPRATPNLSGFSFSDAFVWESRLSNTDVLSSDPIPADSNGNNGFIANRSKSVDGLTIVLNLLAVPNVTRYIESVTFDLYVPADTPFVRGFKENDTTPVSTTTFTKGSGKAWVKALPVNFGDDSRVSRLEFGGQGFGTIGLDNMIIEFTASDIGNGTVPEPTSYALVALALLAAGGASRRRKA